MTNLYELYHCEYKGEVVYIGQGKKGRHKHCNSGCSHVYELNKIHFSEGDEVLQTKILKVSKDKKQIELDEKELIKCYNPRFNTIHTLDSVEKMNLMHRSKIVKKSLLEYRDEITPKLLTTNSEKIYQELCIAFFIFYGSGSILDGDIRIYSVSAFKDFYQPRLQQLSRYLRNDSSRYEVDTNPYALFCRANLNLYNLDLKEKLYNRVDGNVY